MYALYIFNRLTISNLYIKFLNSAHMYKLNKPYIPTFLYGIFLYTLVGDNYLCGQCRVPILTCGYYGMLYLYVYV